MIIKHNKIKILYIRFYYNKVQMADDPNNKADTVVIE